MLAMERGEDKKKGEKQKAEGMEEEVNCDTDS